MAKQEYIDKNINWLKEKSQEAGVVSLGGGVYGKCLKKGSPQGVSPHKGSVVVVHYTGKTINGKKFDSSRGGTPPAFRLRELIEGWGIALRQMRPGDRWEIYIPADKGYGKINQPGIPAGSTLIFDIELINVA